MCSQGLPHPLRGGKCERELPAWPGVSRDGSVQLYVSQSLRARLFKP